MTMILSVFYVVWATILLTHTAVCQTGSDVNSLLTDIYTTRGYNKKIRPIVDQTSVVNIDVTFYLNSVIDFDEKTGSLMTVGYLGVSWIDEYFTWTPASYNNTKFVLIPQDDIWKPDITLKNSFKSLKGMGYSELKAIVLSDGFIKWFPFQVFESTCPVSITYFPFDVQECKLTFIAWSYSIDDVIVKTGKDGIRTEQYVPNASWDLLDTSSGDVINHETGDSAIEFTIRLKRKPRFYIINIILPVFFLSILNVSSFILPVVSGERAGYSITVFLSLAVFLTIVSDQLPNNSENTSFMAVYLMLITGLSTVIVNLCMFQLRLQSWNDTHKPVTKVYRNFVAVHNFCLCCKRSKQSVVPNNKTPSATNLKNDDNVRSIAGGPDDDGGDISTVTWLDVVNALDFIFCCVSLVYTFTCTLVICACMFW